MQEVRIALADFDQTTDHENNFFVNALRRRYNVKIVKPEECDILLYTLFGFENYRYPHPIRIYFTGENDVPDFNLCDYGISFHNVDFEDRHLRLPLYALFPGFERLRSGKALPPRAEHKGFCSFVVSNNWCADPARMQFFQQIQTYKPVASGGREANNIGGPVADKFEFLNQYKFNIAFENSSVSGYTTEKIFDAFAAGTVPIYWGNPNIVQDVNPEAFINVADFANFEEAIEYIKKVDSDPELYNRYLQANPLLNNSYIEWEEILLNFMAPIIENRTKRMAEYGIAGGIRFNNCYNLEMCRRSKTVRRAIKLHDNFERLKKLLHLKSSKRK